MLSHAIWALFLYKIRFKKKIMVDENLGGGGAPVAPPLDPPVNKNKQKTTT